MVTFDADRVLHVEPFLTVTIGIVVLFLGRWLNTRIKVLGEYSIPEPVSGGLFVSLLLTALYVAASVTVAFELTPRDWLLVYFFTTIGMNARIADLKAGGRPLIILLALTAVFIVVQNGVGVGAALLLGQPAPVGLLAGSVSLLGGHGTTIAWAPIFKSDEAIANALELGLVCATMGLVMGSLCGGPLGRFLILRHKLQPEHIESLDVGHVRDGAAEPIDALSFLRALLGLHVSIILGYALEAGFAAVAVKLPLFLCCLMAGIVLTNTLPRILPALNWPSRTPSLALIAELALGVFLALSLMSMQLWTIASFAGTLAVILALQLVVLVAFAILVLFPMLGRGYDAAVICAGFGGFGVGATPTAMANMTAITERYGASHTAFLVVPLVGAFFLDLMNAIVIRVFLSLV